MRKVAGKLVSFDSRQLRPRRLPKPWDHSTDQRLPKVSHSSQTMSTSLQREENC